MVITPFRFFLFVVAAFLAAGGTAYYTGALDGYFAPASRQVAKQDGQGAAGSVAADTDKAARLGSPKAGTENAGQAEDAAVGDEGAAGDKTQETDGTKQAEAIVVPAFDIVRVEPDGSMVVAGHAAPGSNVEVVSGSTIVGKARSGPQGDFAVVLDEPLKPGNHQIVLRSTTPGDVVATSKETAVVSVPETEDGEVLALVEAPGKPSRLITKPAAKESGEKETAEAAEPEADKPAASQDAVGEKAEQTPPHVAMTDPAEGAAGGKDGGDSAAADAGSMEAKDGAPAGEGEAPTPKDDGVATGETAPAKPATGNSAASAEGAGEDKVPASEKNDAKVFIEAVEIDGRDVFVAGGGVPGQRVRVYANDILLGDAVVSPNGRFLVQATRELPVGDYIVRADLLSDNGADVIARAAVPFEREPGEKLSAVAPSSRASDEGAGDVQSAASAGNAGMEGGSGAAGADAAVSADAGRTPSAAAGNAETGSRAGDRIAATDTQGGMKLPDLHNGLAESAPAVTAPKLETVDGAVIIRRGDTLWQISRRVYGRGVRYSTIYLANQQQIRDPDMIWPGQVFSVPQKTTEGEAADMKAIGEQAVPADLAGTEPEWRQ